ncbi:MAG: replication-associated recombination protein A [Bacteroidales bacterium]|nr:replication-associated recombination protein A [Bacteroidales bacterium]
MRKPLAEILRPDTLDDFIGQEHLVGKGAVLRKAIESGNIPSMIFWGPPGVGKTTLAYIISQVLNRQFYTLSAVSSGVKDVRKVIEHAKAVQGAILFIDEIHRFSKSQQDSLLGAVEQGIITLIGATTENPSFEVISPLLSRCQVYILKSLEEEHLDRLMEAGKKELEKHLGKDIVIEEDAALKRVSGGDARKLFNAIDMTASAYASEEKITLTDKKVMEIVQQNLALYDKSGEMHYDIISAYIKSIRGSDPNAAVYWLARMIESGEEPKFIARRLVILASEDVGLANPNALLLAESCFNAVEKVGWPESRIILSEATIYLASSPKSNAAYMAINEAQELVKKEGDLPVPLHIRNAPTKLMKDIGYGKQYKYAHDYPGNFVQQEFMPEKIAGTMLYQPQNNPKEQDIQKRLKNWWRDKYDF